MYSTCLHKYMFTCITAYSKCGRSIAMLSAVCHVSLRRQQAWRYERGPREGRSEGEAAELLSDLVSNGEAYVPCLQLLVHT